MKELSLDVMHMVAGGADSQPDEQQKSPPPPPPPPPPATGGDASDLLGLASCVFGVVALVNNKSATTGQAFAVANACSGPVNNIVKGVGTSQQNDVYLPPGP